MALADYVKQYSNEPLPEIELQRRLLKQRMGEQSNVERQALERRFASMGGGPSGAQVKALGQLGEAQARREEEAQLGLTTQELQARRALEEAEKQRKFITGEREAGQTFAKTMQEQERSAQQAFARGERAAQQEFARGEREAQQVFQKGLTEQDLAFRNKVFESESASRIKQLEIQQQQFKEQMDLEKQAMDFNKQVAQWQMNQPTDLFGSLFGSTFSTQQGSGGIPSQIIGGAQKVGGGIVSAIGGLCFLPGTQIMLETGTHKSIEDLEIGDKCAFGGEIKEIGKSFSTDIYNYLGVYVTGSHGVYENGKWKRVRDSEHGVKLELEGNDVYWISNKYHRLLINNIVFLDFEELDNSEEMSDDHIIEILNGKK